MKICIVGTGTMGHGIAQVFAQAGHEVLLKEMCIRDRLYVCWIRKGIGFLIFIFMILIRLSWPG